MKHRGMQVAHVDGDLYYFESVIVGRTVSHPSVIIKRTMQG